MFLLSILLRPAISSMLWWVSSIDCKGRDGILVFTESLVPYRIFSYFFARKYPVQGTCPGCLPVYRGWYYLDLVRM